jgi:hypothetical protein
MSDNRHASFVENFEPCISVFLRGIMFQTFYSVIITYMVQITESGLGPKSVMG